MTQDHEPPNVGAYDFQLPADSPPPLTPAPTADPSATQYPDVPEATTLPGGDSYHPAPAVMLTPGHGERAVRTGNAPVVAAVIIGMGLLLAAILVSLQLRPVKTVLPSATEEPDMTAPTASSAPATTTPAADDGTRSYEKDSAEPTVEKAKAAFRKHSPGIYQMVQDKDDPAVHPTSQGISFTWDYVDATSSQAVRVHTFTVELDDKGNAIDYYGD